jgi:hypothetical protein
VEVEADLLIAADGIRSTILHRLYEERDRLPCPGIAAEPTTKPRDGSDEASRTRVPLHRHGLRPLGVRLILGIADFDHPLLYERGFYTLDTERGIRLFTMPYRTNRFDGGAATNPSADDGSSIAAKTNTNRVMWQLSFSTPSIHGQHPTVPSLDPNSLRDFVLETCHGWHSPVLDMIQATPIETIWGTDLMDRDPWEVWDRVKKSSPLDGGEGLSRRLVVVGDALHSMSPFKGQGANQALADGPLLADWLQKASVDAALKGWWRETVQRTAPVVQASREAAGELHAGSCCTSHGTGALSGCGEVGNAHSVSNLYSQSYNHGFAGVQPERIRELVGRLEEMKIGAHLGAQLDRRVYEVIEAHGFFVDQEGSGESFPHRDLSSLTLPEPELRRRHQQQHQALQLAANGETQGLRQMSLAKQCGAIITAREEGTQRSCLHLAAIGDHLYCCKWLLAELHMSPATVQTIQDCDKEGVVDATLDVYGKSPYDYALETGNKQLIHIFSVIMNERALT